MSPKNLFRSTLLLAVLAVIATLFGIFSAKTYLQETSNWAIQAVGQDLGTLILVIPALLITAYFSAKRSLRAYLVWLGLLLYMIYAYSIYAFFVHFNFLFLLYVAILSLSFYILAFALSGSKFDAVRDSLNLAVPFKLTYRFLMWFALVFALLWLKEIIPAMLVGKTPLPIVESGLITNPVYVLDLAFFFPGVFLTGYFLKKKNPVGYFFAVPILVFNVAMSVPSMGAAIVMMTKGVRVIYAPIIVMGLVAVASLIIANLFLKNINNHAKF